MIENLLERFAEYYLFVSKNENRIAKENLFAIRSVIFFSVFGGFVYLFVSWALRITTKFEVIFIPFVAEILIFSFLYQKIHMSIIDSMQKVRTFAFCFYLCLTISLAYIETYRNPNVRSFILPAGVFVVAAIYTDYFFFSTILKVLMCAAGIVFSRYMKPKDVADVDMITVIMTFILAIFVFYVIMLKDSMQNQDARIVEKKSVSDMLTGLYNKLAFEEKCKEYLSGRILGAKATLFIFDFDNFKHVNDNYGHQTGDEVLKMFASVLKDYFHTTDIIGRVGGDEFMVLVMGEMPKDFLDNRCRKIQHELRVAKVGEAAGFSCSIGICEDTRARSFEEMYRIADSALYDAKENGKACHVVKTEI